MLFSKFNLLLSKFLIQIKKNCCNDEVRSFIDTMLDRIDSDKDGCVMVEWKEHWGKYVSEIVNSDVSHERWVEMSEGHWIRGVLDGWKNMGENNERLVSLWMRRLAERSIEQPKQTLKQISEDDKTKVEELKKVIFNVKEDDAKKSVLRFLDNNPFVTTVIKDQISCLVDQKLVEEGVDIDKVDDGQRDEVTHNVIKKFLNQNTESIKNTVSEELSKEGGSGGLQQMAAPLLNQILTNPEVQEGASRNGIDINNLRDMNFLTKAVQCMETQDLQKLINMTETPLQAMFSASK